MTTADVGAAIQMLRVVADAIRELGEVPSGNLYAVVCGSMSLETYETIIRQLVAAGLVENKGHLLKWKGPAKTEV